MNRGYRSKLLLSLCFAGLLSGCATADNQANQIRVACNAATVATPLALAVTAGNATERGDVLAAANAIAPLCANPDAAYSDVAIAALLASASLIATYGTVK
jgi:hypothetical protein